MSWMPSNVRRFSRYPFAPRGRRRGNLRWTAQQFEGTVVGDTTVAVPLVLPVDYVTRDQRLEPEGATLMRIRGSWAFLRQTDAPAQLYTGIVSVDKDTNPLQLQADINQNLIDEQWLYHRVWHPRGGTLENDTTGFSIEVDVKAKRRLHDTKIMWVMTNVGAAGATLAVLGVFRCLIRIPN